VLHLAEPAAEFAGDTAAELRLIALPGVGHIDSGADLAALTAAALRRGGIVLHADDVLVFAQKIISKAEGRRIDLATVTVSARARKLALTVQKDPRLVELVLCESRRIVRAAKDVLIVEHLLLPEDPDASAARLRNRLQALTGCAPGVVVSDSFGRPWRVGTVGVAIGCAGFPATLDLKGAADLYGRPLRITVVGHADEAASAASLLMGQAAEARPVILVRGLAACAPHQPAAALMRPPAQDLFR